MTMQKKPKTILVDINEKLTYCAYEWEGEGPPILFCHATGFHGRIWDNVIRKLDNKHVFSLDLRGHGQSTKAPPPYHWDSFANDIIPFIEKMNLSNIIGVGHSMGGYIITTVAGKIPEAFGGLVLCDPSLFDAKRHEETSKRSQLTQDHPASKRRNNWNTPQEMAERLRTHYNFANWEEEALQDYCNYGLVKSDNEDTYHLACPPEIEASMYGANISPVVLENIPKITCPVRILRSRTKGTTPNPNGEPFRDSVTWPGISKQFSNGSDFQYNHCSHFLPQEDSRVVADHINEMSNSLMEN
jgi:pimeloyl-ACP methyl ester carboxylesterase